MNGIYEKAAAIIDDRKEKRRRELDRRRREVFAVAPRIQEIDGCFVAMIKEEV